MGHSATLPQETKDLRPTPSAKSHASSKTGPIKVYMMDLWSFIPYYMAHLCSGLQKESVDVKLGSSRYHLDREYFKKQGLKPDFLLLDNGGSISSYFLRRIVKSLEYMANLFILSIRFLFAPPDILHVQYLPFLEKGLSFEIWFVAWAKRRGVKVLYTVHNVTPQDSPGKYRAHYRRIYGMADILICHGKGARTELTRDFGIPEDRIHIIPHGPLFSERKKISQNEARKKLGLPTEETLVLSLGVISEYKGIPFLLDAWKALIAASGKGRLLIAGTGDVQLLNTIREKVKSENLDASVDLRLEFIAVEQLPLLYEAADILVYPYKAGTTSGALLTGLNYSKAIIATNLPFFREHLQDGVNAYIVEYGDVESLASTMQHLIEKPEVRIRMNEALQRQNSENISWTDIARNTKKCYEQLCERN